MYAHFILITNSFTTGTRVGFHMTAKEGLNGHDIGDKLKQLEQTTKALPGSHYFSLARADWDSVVAFDSFFGDVKPFEDFDEFLEVLKLDTKTYALDVSKVFMAKRRLSHLQVQRLIYLAYEKYLLTYHQPLFDEQILATQYGPIVDEVYQKYKHHQGKILPIDEPTQYRLIDIDINDVLWRMRLVKDTEKIVPLLLDIIEQYGDLSESQLAELTQSPNSPWEMAYRQGVNRQITDDMILYQTIK